MERTFKIIAPEGLHARPSTLLVLAVTPFKSDVQISCKGKSANLKSIMGVMAQGIATGSIITISAEGTDAEEVISKVTEVITSEEIGEEY